MYHEIHTSSAAYTFTLYPMGTRFTPISGIYIFIIIPGYEKDTQHPASIIPQYSLLYIGITADFSTRLKAHHKINQAITLGMTHIGILRKSSGRKRKTIERELLRSHNPPLNQTWL